MLVSRTVARDAHALSQLLGCTPETIWQRASSSWRAVKAWPALPPTRVATSPLLSRPGWCWAVGQLRQPNISSSCSSASPATCTESSSWSGVSWGARFLQAGGASTSCSGRSALNLHRRYSSSSASSSVLNNTTSFLRNLNNGAEIFLVGTAHVSKASAQEVRDTIRLVKPDAVMVELCPGRAARLLSGQAGNSDFLKNALSSLFAPGSSFGQTLFKTSLQGFYRFLQSLGMDPGAEFKAAIEEADAIGARIVYGDRDVQQTLQRLAASFDIQDMLRGMMGSSGAAPPPQDLLDFFERKHGGLEATVEAMKTRAMARKMSDYMRQTNPQLAAALIDERDQYMCDVLSRLQGRVVGVVGLAHLDGIERRWMDLQQAGDAAVARIT